MSAAGEICHTCGGLKSTNHIMALSLNGEACEAFRWLLRTVNLNVNGKWPLDQGFGSWRISRG